MSARALELERLAELAVERWLEGLGAPESIEFETLRARHPTFDVESLDAVAAALRASLAASPDTLPERVRLQLAHGADEYFGPRATPSAGLARTDLDGVSTTVRRHPWFAYGGWLAAAASILVSVGVWKMRPASVEAVRTGAPPPVAATQREIPATPETPATTPARADNVPDQGAPATPRAERADSAAERAQFMRTHVWLMQRSFLPGPDPSGEAVTGDVVWDAKSQTGYLRFRGLRLNDPNVDQYQLWIFDARRDERYPVDGGVFNVSNASGDEVVRFSARLGVEVPLMFVVTVERPGGVVVSDRSRIAAVAHSS